MAKLYLVEFKGSRKEFFYNQYYHALRESDYVVVEVERGEDVGFVKKKIESEVDFSDKDRPGTILRPANQEDVRSLDEIRQKERDYEREVIDMIKRHGLPMKVVDVECQYDGNKMTVFFTADHRVDFRELVKDLAARYRTRIELRQIGVRDEARRIGGYGVCGREQCCTSFLREFEPISTQQARDQDLPLNPSKISGNCGRLLCCLRYEAELYTKVKSRFPTPGRRVKTKHGDGVIERIDVFNEEAVLRQDGITFFRSSADDILELEGGPDPGQTAGRDQLKSNLDAAEGVDVEELKKLEDEGSSGT